MKNYYEVTAYKFNYKTANLKDAENVYNEIARKGRYTELKAVTENEKGYYAKSLKITY